MSDVQKKKKKKRKRVKRPKVESAFPWEQPHPTSQSHTRSPKSGKGYDQMQYRTLPGSFEHGKNR